MKKLFIVIIMLGGLGMIGCKQEKKQDTSNLAETVIQESGDKESEWHLLFDGKTFNGWRGLGMDIIPDKHWTIEDGTIRKLNSGLVPSFPDGQPMEGGDLMTIATFDNYELYFEWKILKAGNSGLKYNVSEEMSKKYDSPNAAIGFEYQLLDDDDESYKVIKASQFSGSLYDMIEAKNVELQPVGKFNTSKIIVNGDHVEHWLNGNKVVEFDYGSARLDSLYKISKYKDYPNFIKKRKGHIVLQNHDDDAWFRNIKIREFKSNQE
ncbi:3-keto-disaccharide hydrolase [Zobellia nedashkovskayae]|uniref:3-keto-disaccharide hydrolase n=1 Tax=Zobellia nedashkovskayae TaxID=2779510 RepID=UPI00188A5873|nr:DUF1080 domain-containing protein [Zobellia nedashkovskayae]